ncbi:MAG: type III ribulose-bisphosphate carboxylase [Candidatus Diapherotrites archaeon]|nr:type III ribulose-bisphosphate carboxylase [Candidatus Diapherotrites archaeon]
MAGYEDFVDLEYKPNNKDVIASFKVKVPDWETPEKAFGAVASESSVGTWTDLNIWEKYPHVKKVAAKVYSIEHSPNGYWIKIAYPEDHFEQNNPSQILASIAGNVFGMKAVDGLRLQDISFTKTMMKEYRGPQFGINGIRKIFNAEKRPLMLSVAKPKVGMTTAEHADIGYQIWTGGLDLLKDDENLTNQKFNPFKKRVTASLKLRNKAEKETGERKSYLINVTAPTVQEMIERARFVKKEGGEYVMIDIIASGWTAVNSLREECEDLGLAIHAHRAMHGAMTRNQDHGFSMNCVSKFARLIGVDQLHIGTVFGKLVSPKEEVLECQKNLTQVKVKPDMTHHYLEQNWEKMEQVFPVSSGGLHPGIVDKIMGLLGTNIMLQLGGGVHGHPNGSYAGAVAMRAAVEAYLDKISAEEKAKTCPELKIALKQWGHTAPK